jgi:hypothetical protein
MAVDCSSGEENNNRMNSTSFSFKLVLIFIANVVSPAVSAALQCYRPHATRENSFLGLTLRPSKKLAQKKLG